MRSKWLLASALLLWLSPIGASAVTLPLLSPTGFGLDEFFGCPVGDTCTPTSNVFDLSGLPPATGTLTITDPLVNFSPTSATLTLTLPTATVTASPAANGVDEIVFSSLVYSASFTIIPIASGSNWDLQGNASFSVSDDYEQLLLGSNVQGPDTLGLSIQGQVACLVSMADPAGPGGQCGIAFNDGDFVIGVGASGSQVDYAFEQNFNLFVPEPTTAVLTAAGLLSLGVASRRRHARALRLDRLTPSGGGGINGRWT